MRHQHVIHSFVSPFCFNDPASTEIYTLSLHDALPICAALQIAEGWTVDLPEKVHNALDQRTNPIWPTTWFAPRITGHGRSEEHTSELQSQFHLVCRLLLEKKNKSAPRTTCSTPTSPPN